MSNYVQKVYNKYLNRQKITVEDQELAKNEIKERARAARSLFKASGKDEESSSPKANIPQVDYQVIKTIVDPIPEAQSLEIACLAKPIFSNIPPSQSGGVIYVLEDEVNGSPTGDFIGQCVSALSGAPALGHNPDDEPQDVNDTNRVDKVGIVLYTNKAHTNGTMEWLIPTIFTDENDIEIARITVVQKFVLQDGIMTIYKAGKELMKENTNSY